MVKYIFDSNFFGFKKITFKEFFLQEKIFL